ncbi:outer membrane protein assembly factor BamB family protein [Gimesia aquarii]|uniref:Alcohol dehydrogenase [cytochrome c] n=1 Tax=Gimesia aquarii TaxID=2527964 RepID=A0A517W0Y9_9PLAN|nr:PQQ-binding-like beta-propeller repeat protein [Gimesia aquarii]QDT98922.1 Alcohol dehydrogenase [cytochrome c] precursor [Gimesia aquarii]
MMNYISQRISILIVSSCFFTALMMGLDNANSSDWPMWRQNAGRTGVTTESLPEKLSLKWVRQLPEITPAFHNARLQFDAGYEPIVADGVLLIASSRNDSVTAYEAATGRELWVYHINGPVRFAPAVWQDYVCFGSDDGFLYCVELSTGKLRWKHRAVPNERRLLGNQRLISVWPVRGGPVVSEGIVYFAAGVWPFEGVFVYAMDIATGNVIWRNERLGYLFGQQPHNTKAIGGLAPQGYLIVNGDELIVPCSTAYPARLNRKTGELIEFKLPTEGGFPGGWFAALDPEDAKAIRRGKLAFDKVINSQRHEDKVRKGLGKQSISRVIRAGDRSLNFDDKLDGVGGVIHSMIVADGRLFVATRNGKLYCFEEQKGVKSTPVKQWQESVTPLTTTPQSTRFVKSLIQESAGPQGIALVVGLKNGSLVKALLKESNYHVIAFDHHTDRVDQLRGELQGAELYGTRAAVIECDPKQVTLPPYLASVIVTETPEQIAESWNQLLQSLRPFGGLAVLGIKHHTSINNDLNLKSLKPGNFELSEFELTKTEPSEFEELALVRRVGALPGTADYQGGYKHCEDTLVRFPLGVLWFDDTLAHFKRSPQPHFFNGIMVSRPKDWHATRVKGDWSIDYPLNRPVLSDIYTGRVLEPSEQTTLRKNLAANPTGPQPSYYHAPHQKTMLHPDPPVAGERINPLTGLKEPRAFPKMYGCDGGVDYGLFYTLRSGTASYYDKTLESGTVFISGPRSGCSNSIIPSGGLLNVPYFYEGCTCSYPLPAGLSMVAMPESFEQWSSWGEDKIKPASIQRIGLNFGAPGDRKTRNGTLWLDYPSIGGPSPQIRVETKPKNPKYRYRHTNWMQGDNEWPWVAASTVKGLQELTLHDLKPGTYTVKLYFAEVDDIQPGQRKQTISLQGQPVLSDFDILAEAKQSMTGITRQVENIKVDGTLTMTLQALTGNSLISGIEITRAP